MPGNGDGTASQRWAGRLLGDRRARVGGAGLMVRGPFMGADPGPALGNRLFQRHEDLRPHRYDAAFTEPPPPRPETARAEAGPVPVT